MNLRMFFLEMLGQKYFVFSAGFKWICLGNTWQSSSFIPVVLTEVEGRGSCFLPTLPPTQGTLGNIWKRFSVVTSLGVCGVGRGVSILT